MKNRLLKAFVFVLLCFIFVSSGYSAVEIFTKYDTTVSIHSNESMDVHKSMRLRNIHVVGIVPGRIEFKIPKIADGSVSEVKLENFRALDRYGNPIKSQVFETKNTTVIALDIFTPLLPGFEYVIDMYYTLSYDSSGLFFKNLEVPLKDESSVEIQKGTFNLQLPDNYHFTYISFKDNNTILEGNTVTWNVDRSAPDSVRMEYSYIPVKIGNMKGSYVFWILINIVLLLILTFEIRKEEIGRAHV